MDWLLFAMTALTAASSRLEVDLRDRRGGNGLTATLLHPALFACAIILGPARTVVPALAAGICRLLEDPKSHRLLDRLIQHLLAPVLAAPACSLVFVACSGNLTRPHSVDSLAGLACGAVIYALLSDFLSGLNSLTRKPTTTEARPALNRQTQTIRWAVSLLCGYMLAVLSASAPAYALYAISTGAVATSWLLYWSNRRGSTSLCEPNPHSDQTAVRAPATFIDEATGLANRRYLELFLQRELVRSERFGKAISAAVFNVDGFKNLEENCARSIMAELCNRLTAGIREYDIAAKHSDGRLVVVLPETPFETALDVVDRLRSSLSAAGIRVSVGLATYPEHASDAQELINAAHHALNRGRSEECDRVHYPQKLAKAS